MKNNSIFLKHTYNFHQVFTKNTFICTDFNCLRIIFTHCLRIIFSKTTQHTHPTPPPLKHFMLRHVITTTQTKDDK